MSKRRINLRQTSCLDVASCLQSIEPHYIFDSDGFLSKDDEALEEADYLDGKKKNCCTMVI